MQKPLVSVQMITYNHKPYITKAIESVLSQKTNFPFELVIGEDCSTDGTQDIVYAYQNKYPEIINVITSKQNVGMHENCYRAEMSCRGEYIAYCEGDDYWHRDDKLQKQRDYMAAHPECSLVCSDYDIHVISENLTYPNINAVKGLNPSAVSDIVYILRGTSGIQTCTVMAKKELLFQVINSDSTLYLKSLFPAGDLPRWFELSLLGKIGYIDESLATYNRLPVSATSNLDLTKMLKTSIAMKKMILYLIDKHRLSTQERIRHLRDIQIRTIKLAYYEQNSDSLKVFDQIQKPLLPIEQIYLLGIQHPYLRLFLKPFILLLDRQIIPTLK